MIDVRSPFPISELPQVWRWAAPVRHKLMADDGPRNLTSFIEGEVRRMRSAITFGVWRDKELGGYIRFDVAPNLQEAAGHCLFKRTFYGWETTRTAIIDSLTQMFDHGFEKIVMVIFENNSAIKRLLESLGVEKEAVWYEALTVDGDPMNMIQYRMTAAMMKEIPCRS